MTTDSSGSSGNLSSQTLTASGARAVRAKTFAPSPKSLTVSENLKILGMEARVEEAVRKDRSVSGKVIERNDEDGTLRIRTDKGDILLKNVPETKTAQDLPRKGEQVEIRFPDETPLPVPVSSARPNNAERPVDPALEEIVRPERPEQYSRPTPVQITEFSKSGVFEQTSLYRQVIAELRPISPEQAQNLQIFQNLATHTLVEPVPLPAAASILPAPPPAPLPDAVIPAASLPPAVDPNPALSVPVPSSPAPGPALLLAFVPPPDSAITEPETTTWLRPFPSPAAAVAVLSATHGNVGASSLSVSPLPSSTPPPPEPLFTAPPQKAVLSLPADGTGTAIPAGPQNIREPLSPFFPLSVQSLPVQQTGELSFYLPPSPPATGQSPQHQAVLKLWKGPAAPPSFASVTLPDNLTPPGSPVLFAPIPSEIPVSTEKSSAPVPPGTSPPKADNISLFSSPGLWGSLQEAGFILQGLPEVSTSSPQHRTASAALLSPSVTQFAATLPNAAAPPAQLGAALLLFIHTLKNGDLSAWLGERSIETLRRAGKDGLLQRLAGEWQNLSAQARTPAPGTGEWRALPLPMYTENEIRHITLYYQQGGSEQENEQACGKKSNRARFVFDLSLSRMGAVQVDGLFQNDILDIALRTRLPVGPDMRETMVRRYAAALESCRISGALYFYHGDDQMIDTADLAAPTLKDLVHGQNSLV